MNSKDLFRTGIFTLLLTLVFVLLWENYWRSQGFPASYNDNNALWANKRAEVYQPAQKSTVFIGSSRIKFDLNIDMWRKITGTDAVQLAEPGTSPRPFLQDLANDPKFNGNLIVDVTEGTFFSATGGRKEKTAIGDLDYWYKLTPAKRVSFVLNHFLESKLVFLDENFLSLNPLLELTHLPDRKGYRGPPRFPPKFSFKTFDRQTVMSDAFLADTAMQHKVENVWNMELHSPPDHSFSADQIFKEVKECVDKIRARGGKVLFVRTPSSGPYLAYEQRVFPRVKFWDRLLTETGCQGIYFADYPDIAHFTCPEWSHLSPADGREFTESFINILYDKGWPIKSVSL